jgi:hypothetical protein
MFTLVLKLKNANNKRTKSVLLIFHIMTLWIGFFDDFSIQALLSAPNPDDPLSDNIAKHWKSNEAEAVETGKDLKLTRTVPAVLLLEPKY